MAWKSARLNSIWPSMNLAVTVFVREGSDCRKRVGYPWPRLWLSLAVKEKCSIKVVEGTVRPMSLTVP
jgi:hypothetical protein